MKFLGIVAKWTEKSWLQIRYLRLSSTTPSSPSLAKISYDNIPIYFIRILLSFPSSLTVFRSRFPAEQGAAAAALSLQSFASPTSGPPSLFQVLLRVSVARFHESFHAFPSHLGDGDGSFPFPRSPFIDRLGSLSNQPPSLVSAHQPVSIISPAFSNKGKLERSS